MQSYVDAQRKRILAATQELATDRRTLRSDVFAGLTFAAVNIPQGLAFALMAGITPINGLYTLMIGTPIAALFSGAAFLNVSSTGALSASIADVLQGVAFANRMPALGMLAFMMGIFMIVLGIMRLGWIMRFVPNAVMVGFIAAVAINIVLGQIADLTGFQSLESNRLLQLADTLVNRQSIELPALFTGIVTIAVILLLEKTRFKGIALLAALAVASGAAGLLAPNTVEVVGDVTQIPRALPQPVGLTFGLLRDMAVPSISLGILALVQAAAVGQSFPNPNGKYGDLNRDFVAQGLSNVALGFFQGLPAGGSASGTAVVVAAGARSRWANIFAGIFVILIVLTLGQVAELVAMPALAGLLIVVGFRMLNWNAIATVWRTSTLARTSALITFAFGLTVPLQYAIFVGVGVAIVINVFSQADRVRLVEYVWSDAIYPEERDAPETLRSDGVTCLTVHGNLFFAAAATVEQALPDALSARNAVVLLLLRGHQEVGSTLVGVLDRYVQDLQVNGNRLILVGVSEEVALQLERTGITARMGPESVYVARERLGEALALAYREAVQWLAKRGVESPHPFLLAPEHSEPRSAKVDAANPATPESRST